MKLDELRKDERAKMRSRTLHQIKKEIEGEIEKGNFITEYDSKGVKHIFLKLGSLNEILNKI